MATIKRKVGRPKKLTTGMNPNESAVSDRLQVLFNLLQLTQIEAAEKLGVKQNTISRILLKKNAPSLGLILKILSAFDVNANWLLSGVGNIFNKNSGNNLIDRKELKPIIIKLKGMVSSLEEKMNPLTKN